MFPQRRKDAKKDNKRKFLSQRFLFAPLRLCGKV
jgi:hypothetical protein